MNSPFARLVFVACSALVLATIAGLPWVLLTGLELWLSPLVGAIALAISKR